MSRKSVERPNVVIQVINTQLLLSLLLGCLLVILFRFTAYYVGWFVAWLWLFAVHIRVLGVVVFESVRSWIAQISIDVLVRVVLNQFFCIICSI